MNVTSRWNRVPAIASLLLMGVLFMGANDDGCGPIDPPLESENQCTLPADCEGLPHVMCLGGWECVSGACQWKCDTTPVECTSNADCPTGQECTFTTKCPDCVYADMPCKMACQQVGQCTDIVTPTECVVGGCSGELCLPKGQDMASPCWYLEWFKCLQYSSCGSFGENGTCGWEQTDAFKACMAGLGCNDGNECPSGYSCVDNVCVKPQEPVGCHSNEDCKAGFHCSVSDGVCNSDPNCPACDVCYGECVADVPVDCVTDADCAEGYICQTVQECPSCVYENPPCKVACRARSQCVLKPITNCTTDADCPEGQYCRLDACPADMNCVAPDGTTNCLCTGTCQPKEQPLACLTDADCPKGQRCYWTGVCPVCECDPAAGECACPDCVPAETGFCGPYCDPNLPEVCGNGLDDNCNGLVDENCTTPTPCIQDADCAAYEYCAFDYHVYDEAGNLLCCPAYVKCTSEIPPCGQGVCRLQAGYCWTDADCVYGEQCVGAITCPDGAMCFAAEQPGKCQVAQRIPCTGDADCPEGQVCQWDYGCPPCDCAPDDPTCACPMCMPAMNGWCVPSTCIDRDADGWCATDDCDDANAIVFPGAYDGCDGLDNNCDGIVDENCMPQCYSDADCAPYETCQFVYATDPASGIACCPPNAFCDATIPPCGGGVCVLQAGYCWTDADCGYGEKCEGAIVCPEGAACFVADQPGKCVDAGLKCASDAQCLDGMYCDFSRVWDGTCCLPGEICLMIYLPCEGLCTLQEGRCWTDADCPNGGTCEGARVCPEGALCILADAAGTCANPLPAKCGADADCKEGQMCRQVSVCPPCTGMIPPCEMPCTLEGQCMNQCLTNDDCLPNQYCEITRCGSAGLRCLGPYYCAPYGLD